MVVNFFLFHISWRIKKTIEIDFLKTNSADVTQAISLITKGVLKAASSHINFPIAAGVDNICGFCLKVSCRLRKSFFMAIGGFRKLSWSSNIRFLNT
jgi:hypothetical protein